MEVIEKTEGRKIAWEITKSSIIFGDDDLSVNLKNREMDDDVWVDVCADENGFLVIGAAAGRRYVAQVKIPARRYTESYSVTEMDENGNMLVERKAEPFQIDNCVLYLWGLGVA